MCKRRGDVTFRQPRNAELGQEVALVWIGYLSPGVGDRDHERPGEVDRSITGEDVADTLEYLFQVHGEPEFIRSDNGPEFFSEAVRKWLEDSGVRTLFIEPGSPWENAYSESFNSRLRDELQNQEIFTCLTEARVMPERHRVYHNLDRPHSSLGYQTPAEFAASLTEQVPLPCVAGEVLDSPEEGEAGLFPPFFGPSELSF